MPDEKTKTTLKIEKIEIDRGDEFTIEGIEQGSKWTAEHTRIERIEFIPQETTASPPTQSEKPTAVKPVEVEVEFDVNKQWNGGFDSNISFTNNGKQFQGWKVLFMGEERVQSGGQIMK